MSATFDLAEAIVQFTSCTETNWDNFNLPIPQNVVIVTADTKKFKRGDGIHLYVDLPDGPTIAGIAEGEGSLINVLVQLNAFDEDDIIIIDNEMYSASGTKLTDLINRINAIENKDAIQDANLLSIAQQFNMLDTTVDNTDDGKLGIILNGKIAPGPYPEDIVVPTEPVPIHIVDFNIYEDEKLSSVATELFGGLSYYVFINPSHDEADIDNLTYGVTTTSNDITATQIERGLFKIDVGQVTFDHSATFTATLSYNTDTVSIDKSIDVSRSQGVFIALYGGTSVDTFNTVAIDSSNNIYAAGYTSSEGSGGNDTLIVKFDSSLNKLAGKVYGGSGIDQFLSMTIDSSDSVYVVGYTMSEGVAGDALIVKFDSDLTILVRKRYGGSYIEQFLDITIDSSDNIYVVGYTNSEGVGSTTYSSSLIIKFDTNLDIIARKTYSGASTDVFRGVAVDSLGNIYAVGNTSSEGTGGDAFIIKFDSSLNKLAGKRYGGTTGDVFYKITIDSSNNIYVVGNTKSEGVGSTTYLSSLIIKFDSSLNKLAGKSYSGSGNDFFYNITTDSSDNVYVVGRTYSEGTNIGINGFFIKFDSSLNKLAGRVLDGTDGDEFYDITTDSYDNIYTVGYTTSEGLGSGDAFIMRTGTDIQSGTFTSSTLSNLSFIDSNLTLADSALTLADSGLTVGSSILTLNTSNLTSADSNLTLEKATFI
jgi:hypothetical protein